MATDDSTVFTTLDHVDNITVPGNVFDAPSNEYWALMYLRDGMEFLYRRAVECDRAAKQELNPDDDRIVYAFGNHPGLRAISTSLLTNAFQWYAISACQYVLTVGAIAKKQDPERPKAKKYVEQVIPAVFMYRNKVAAHFVWSLDDNRDNEAEKLASIIPQISFINDSFHTASFTTFVRSGGKPSDSSKLQEWSLCKVHETLRARYWPQENS